MPHRQKITLLIAFGVLVTMRNFSPNSSRYPLVSIARRALRNNKCIRIIRLKLRNQLSNCERHFLFLPDKWMQRQIATIYRTLTHLLSNSKAIGSRSRSSFRVNVLPLSSMNLSRVSSPLLNSAYRFGPRMSR